MNINYTWIYTFIGTVVLEDTPVYARVVGPDNHTVKEKRCGSRAEAGTVEELERERERESEGERQSVER